MIKFKPISRKGSRTGKKILTEKVEVKVIEVVFKTDRCYRSNYRKVVSMFEELLEEKFDIEYNWKDNTLKLVAKKAFFYKEKEIVEVQLKDWRKKLKTELFGKRLKVYTQLICQQNQPGGVRIDIK